MVKVTSGAESSVDCAAIWREAVGRVQERQRALSDFMTTNRAGYDRHFDRPERLRSEFPDDQKIVERIDELGVQVVAARDALPKAFEAAMVAKAVELAGAGREPLDPAADMEEFRRWRVADLDGIDVDAVGLLSDRPLRVGAKAPLYDRVFAAWAKAAKIDLEEAVAMLGAAASPALK